MLNASRFSIPEPTRFPGGRHRQPLSLQNLGSIGLGLTSRESLDQNGPHAKKTLIVLVIKHYKKDSEQLPVSVLLDLFCHR